MIVEKTKEMDKKDAIEKMGGLSRGNTTTRTECCARVLFHHDVLRHGRKRDGISVAYIRFIELHL
jgi:hypothetical protein